jgi:ABC-type multidrug transport system fused ATPase/permease subunit
MHHDPRATYQQRIERFTTECNVLATRSRRLANARAAVFIALVAAGLAIERRPGTLTVASAITLLLIFIALVVLHRRVRRQEERYRELVAVNREGVHRLDRNWDDLPLHPPPADIGTHAYAADLDLFGRASLTQILGPAGSAHGAATLEAWLLHRAEPGTVRQRQSAVRELAALHELRDALAINGRRTRAVRHGDVERFLAWAESATMLTGRPWLRALAWILPILAWSLLALLIAGVIQGTWWLLPAGGALALYSLTGSAVRHRLDEAFGREGLFTHYPELIALITRTPFEAPLLRAGQQRLLQTDQPADRQIARLRRLMHLADLRLSSMLHLPIYAMTVWDVHVLAALEKWQAQAGSAVRGWLDAVGEFEAIASLASLAHDQPAWTFPQLDTGAHPVFRAVALGHPLLPDHTRVTNDVVVGPPGTFLLVTGSNMSGKSTLLRAIGINAVLAQAGAPVCARSLVMPPLAVATSIRVQDSLERGVSHFMAELERLKQIVDAADALCATGGATLLFLLDEILHGTNTAERRIAARRVIRHLVDSGAIGAVTTHDLELAAEPVLAPHARLVHFRESFRDGDGAASILHFDYLLRDGLATSTNALILMRLVGLPGEP